LKKKVNPWFLFLSILIGAMIGVIGILMLPFFCVGIYGWSVFRNGK